MGAAEQKSTKEGRSKGAPDQSGRFEGEVERVARRQPTWRSPLLSAAVSVFALVLAWGYRGELAYFLSDPMPIDLGEGYDLSPARHNVFAEVTGLPSALKAGYKQYGRSYKVYYLLGTRLFVREERPDEKEPVAGAPEAPAEEFYPTFSGRGRLLNLSESPDFGNVKGFYEARTEWDFRKPTWMLLAGVEPRRQWQYPGLIALLVLVAVGNVFLLIRRRGRR